MGDGPPPREEEGPSAIDAILPKDMAKRAEAVGYVAMLAGAGFRAGASAAHPELSIGGFLRVLAPVTLGNILGGGVLVALVYPFVYLRPQRTPS